MAMRSMSPAPFVQTEPLLTYSFELATEHLTQTVKWLVENVSKQQSELEVQREKLARIEEGSDLAATPIQCESLALGSLSDGGTKVSVNHENKSALASFVNGGADRSGNGGGNAVAGTMDAPGNGLHHGTREAMAPDVDSIVATGGGNVVAGTLEVPSNEPHDVTGEAMAPDVPLSVDSDELARPSESMLRGRPRLEEDVGGNKSSTPVKNKRIASEVNCQNEVDDPDEKQCEEKALELLDNDLLHKSETRKLHENLEQVKSEIVARLDKLEHESAEMMRMSKHGGRITSRTIHAPPSGTAGDTPCMCDGSAPCAAAASTSVDDTVSVPAALSREEATSRDDPGGATVSMDNASTIHNAADLGDEVVHHASGSASSGGKRGTTGGPSAHGPTDAGAVMAIAQHVGQATAAASAAQQAAQQAMEAAEAAKAVVSCVSGQQGMPEFEDSVAAGAVPGGSLNDARSAGHTSLFPGTGNLMLGTGNASAVLAVGSSAAGTAQGTFHEDRGVYDERAAAYSASPQTGVASAAEVGKSSLVRMANRSSLTGDGARHASQFSASATDVEAEVKSQLEGLRLELQHNMHNLRRDMERMMSELSYPTVDTPSFGQSPPPPAPQFTQEAVGLGPRSSQIVRKPLSDDGGSVPTGGNGSLIRESSLQLSGNSDHPTSASQGHLGKLSSESGEKCLANRSQGKNGGTLAVDPAGSLAFEEGGMGASVVNDGLGGLHLRVAALEAALHGVRPRPRVAGDLGSSAAGQMTDHDSTHASDLADPKAACARLLTGNGTAGGVLLRTGKEGDQGQQQQSWMAGATSSGLQDVEWLRASADGTSAEPASSGSTAALVFTATPSLGCVEFLSPERTKADNGEDRDHQSQAQNGKSSPLQDPKASRQKATHATRAAVASGKALAVRPTAGWEDPRIQAELEHFRKLFEFIEGVLPSDAAEAMRFFSQEGRGRHGVGSGMTTDRACGQNAECTEVMAGANLGALKRHLQEQVDQHIADTRHDHDNLTNAIKGLQRGLEHSQGRIGELVQKVAGIWRERELIPQPRQGLQHSETAGVVGQERTVDAMSVSVVAASDANESTCRERGEDSLKGHSSQNLAQPAVDDGSQNRPRVASCDYVSQQVLDEALNGLKEDVRSWLDALRDSMMVALQHKADSENLKDIVCQVSQTMDSAGDNFALFAKRTLVGKCASCDTPFAVDPSLVRRTPPTSLERPWPTRSTIGAQVSIRKFVEGGSNRSPFLPGVQAARRDSGSRLTRLQDARATRDPGRGRVIRNISSQPELRGWRQDHQRPDDLSDSI